MPRTGLNSQNLSAISHLPKKDLTVSASLADKDFMAIRRLPLLSGASEEALAKLVSQSHWRIYAAGETVVDLGDATDDVFFITEGAVRVVLRTAFGYESILNDLRVGDFFGELAAIDGYQRSANATALQNTRLLVVPALVFMELVLSCPDIMKSLLRLFSARLRLKDERLIEFGSLSVRQRLIAELLRLSRDRGGAERVLSPPPTQQELADRIGTRRETVSRELTQMAGAGLLTTGRRAIILHWPDRLRKEVETRPLGRMEPSMGQGQRR